MATICLYVQPSQVKEEDIDGTVLDDVDGIPLEEIDGTPLDAEPSLKDKPNDNTDNDDDINGVPMKSIVPYGDDIDGEPSMYLSIRTFVYCNINNLRMSSNALSVSAVEQVSFRLFAESV